MRMLFLLIIELSLYLFYTILMRLVYQVCHSYSLSIFLFQSLRHNSIIIAHLPQDNRNCHKYQYLCLTSIDGSIYHHPNSGAILDMFILIPYSLFSFILTLFLQIYCVCFNYPNSSPTFLRRKIKGSGCSPLSVGIFSIITLSKPYYQSHFYPYKRIRYTLYP